MRNIARIAEQDRNALFRNTSAKFGLSEAIIEKDFWVCYMLDYLFHRSKWASNLAFKGGTSLSKAYGLIKRFSEDIDLILDWRVLGYGINEPWEQRSNTKQDAFNKEANIRAEKFLQENFLPEITSDLTAELGKDASCYIDTNNKQTVIFSYPRAFADTAVLQEIRLEIGALAAWTPAKEQTITSYAAQKYAKKFNNPSTSILTVLPERTFWEKVTILHREANRLENSKMPARYSRHYYDLYCMSHSPVKDKALNDVELLNKVVTFKDKFYRCFWAGYEYAKRGTMKLLPPDRCMNDLKADYMHMQNMIFDHAPAFDEIIKGIAALEKEINTVKK